LQIGAIERIANILDALKRQSTQQAIFQFVEFLRLRKQLSGLLEAFWDGQGFRCHRPQLRPGKGCQVLAQTGPF